MSNQSGRHAAINAILGITGGTYEGSFHALFDDAGIATGPFNGRLLAWINDYLGTSYTDLPGAQHAYAVSLGFNDWNSLNTWEANNYEGPYEGLTTAPVIAAGMTRLVSSYEGSLIRLVRNDDDAEMDFGYDADGNLDTAAIATWLGESAGLGTKWYNQYTAGEDYVQATKDNMPTFSATGLNSGPCFVFDGSNDYLEASITAITGTTLFNAALCRPVTGTVVYDGITTAYDSTKASDYQFATAMTLNWYDNTPAGQTFRNNANALRTSAGAALNSNAVYSARADGTNIYADVNGTESAGTASTGNFGVNRHILAARWTASARSNFMVGSLAGVALFNVDPGSTDRGIVIDYLKSVGGIA